MSSKTFIIFRVVFECEQQHCNVHLARVRSTEQCSVNKWSNWIGGLCVCMQDCIDDGWLVGRSVWHWVCERATVYLYRSRTAAAGSTASGLWQTPRWSLATIQQVMSTVPRSAVVWIQTCWQTALIQVSSSIECGRQVYQSTWYSVRCWWW